MPKNSSPKKLFTWALIHSFSIVPFFFYVSPEAGMNIEMAKNTVIWYSERENKRIMTENCQKMTFWHINSTRSSRGLFLWCIPKKRFFRPRKFRKVIRENADRKSNRIQYTYTYIFCACCVLELITLFPAIFISFYNFSISFVHSSFFFVPFEDKKKQKKIRKSLRCCFCSPKSSISLKLIFQ